jgi:hypothetical protein
MMSLVAIAAFGMAGQVTPPSAAEVERRALEHRRSIRSAHVVCKQKTYDAGAASPDRERVTTIWYDGMRIRADILLSYQKGAPPHREVDCLGCERPDHYVAYGEQKVEGGVLALECRPVDKRRPPTLRVIDPRLIGMAPDSSPNLRKYHLESFLGRADRSPPTVEASNWKGEKVWRVSYSDFKNVQYRIWIVPDYGYGVTRIEAEWNASGKHFLDSIESEYSQVGTMGFWFPTRCIYERIANEKPVEKEVMDIEFVSINEPVDPGAFQLSGMNIRPNTPITGIHGPRGEELIWDGNELVPEVLLPLNKYVSGSSWRQKLLFGNAVIFGLIAAFFLWRFLFRKGPAGKPS